MRDGNEIPPDAAALVRTELTILAKSHGPLSKRITLGDDGKPIADGSACVMAAGSARRAPVDGAADLAALIGRLGSSEALALGRLRADLPDAVRIVTEAARRKLDATGAADTISRTSDYLSYRPGEPAWCLIDFDMKAMPLAVAEKIADAGGVEGAIRELVSGFDAAASVTRASTSAGLRNTQTGEAFRGSGGLHLFVLVRDGEDIERFLAALHKRCWLAGVGWGMLSRAGGFLERAIVDRSVAAPERLVFEGPPILVPPLEQDAVLRCPMAREGEALDTEVACPPLTIAELARVKQLIAAERHRLKPESARVRAEFVAEHAEKIAARTGVPIDRAREIAGKHAGGTLLPSVALAFDDPELAGATVADVLADPARFLGQTLADPIEGVGYGAGKSMILRRADGEVWVNSFAHGGVIYTLRYDVAAIRAAIDAAPAERAVAVFVTLCLAGDLNDDEIDQLTEQVASRAGVSKRTVTRAWKAAQEKRQSQRAREAADRRAANRRDPRPAIEAPMGDAPWLPVMTTLNEVLGSSAAPEPPMRDIDGYACEVRKRPVIGLHTLTAGGANGEKKTEDRLPPPEQPLLTRLTETELAEVIERHIDFFTVTSDGDERSVHLAGPFVRHYHRRSDKVLPTVQAVATLPMVLPNGEVLTGRGLDRKHATVFRVSAELDRVMPRADECDDRAVAEAMRFLADDWLADVATDYAGKCIAIALVGTLIERLLLDCRPAFFISAGQRGSGKTTLASMCAMAALGTPAAASAWSQNAEEMRKNLFSLLLEGAPLVAWDNLPRGLQVSDASLEKALTATEFADRVLGVSQRATAPAFTVHCITGNNVGARGDMVSRSLLVRLVADRTDPENRSFRHADPIGWTSRHRGKILRAVYTVLLGNPRLRQANPAPAETRFKAWWHLIGAAVEHAAEIATGGREKFSFGKMFLAGEEGDEQTGGMAEVLSALRHRWPAGFTAADVATFVSGPTAEAGAFKAAVELATGKAMPMVSSIGMAARLRGLVDAPVTIDRQTWVLRHVAASDRHHSGAMFRIRGVA